METKLSPKNINDELERTQASQLKASDPHTSVWVSANAGTGKTHVLTMRVLRLLLSGTEPERILCLTYTRAAATEMSKRVFSELSRFVGLDDQSLHKALFSILQKEPTLEEKARARTLFTKSIETPGGFKAQTIHAFSERLLQRFPLEAGVTPGFKILDQTEAEQLKQRAIDKVLEETLRKTNSSLSKALSIAVSYTTEVAFENLLGEILKFHVWIEDTFELFQENKNEVQSKLKEIENALNKHFGIKTSDDQKLLREKIIKTFSLFEWLEFAKKCDQGTITDINRAKSMRNLCASKNKDEFLKNIYKIFFDTNEKPRKSFTTKALQKKYPEIEKTFLDLQPNFLELWKELKAKELIEATLALYELAAAILHEYQNEKARCAKLDFEDLIIRTKSLLLNREASQWVLYKMDSGLDHLLVDESQDTSLSQWTVVLALVQEFFSGDGANHTERTIFAVGDEKQSIFSFQGAAPEMFMALGEKIKLLASQAGKKFQKIDLNVSFRSTKPILDAVDKIFSDPARTPGVSHDDNGIRHISKRYNQEGSIEVWNKELYLPSKVTDPWSPREEEYIKSPIERLAYRIASTIESWLQKGERLGSADRTIRPGDILILVRNRHPFADAILVALKSRGIPVAGADRLRLTEHIVIQDLLSLGDFILLPEDDLALAEVLKSPIFGFDDEDLIKISIGRSNSLWKALLQKKDLDGRFSNAVELLKHWRSAADFMPPYEFWARLLDNDGVRNSFINRIGPEAAEPLDEFLNLALNYDLNAPASLTGFIQKISQEDREIKRDTDATRDEVRIMTVHGAKGLEAPIVFLPDTCCSGRRKLETRGLLKLEDHLQTKNELLPPFVWQIKGTHNLKEIKEARAYLEKREKEEQERLLYVALTRARDRLIIGSFENKIGCSQCCWYSLICDMLSVKIDPLENKKILYQDICTTSSDTKPDYQKNLPSSLQQNVQLPAWIKTKAPKDNVVFIPIKPSQMVPFILDNEGEPSIETHPLNKVTEPESFRFITTKEKKNEFARNPFIRGLLTHSLLQYLPKIPSSIWQEAAVHYVRKKSPNIPNVLSSSIIKEALDVLSDPFFSALFSSSSQSEVPIVAKILDPKGTNKTIHITGQIDRLAVKENEILIVDFKSNRRAPTSLSEVANIYLYQLAAYRIGLLQIFKDRPIRAALLWTETPKLMEIPVEILDKFTKDLWSLDISNLDGNPYDS